LSYAADSRGCGKTVAMEATGAFCPEFVSVAYSTNQALKGWIDEHPTSTVGMDELDQMFGATGRTTGGRAEIMAVLNAGYASDGKVMCVRSGKSVLMYIYNVMITAGIGRVPETLLDRSLQLTLHKAMPDEVWISVLHSRELQRTGKEIAEWCGTKQVRKHLANAPRMADIPGDPRRKLIMAPMAAIASAAGFYDEWREADEEIQSGIAANPQPSRSEMLLASLVSMAGHIVTADDVRALNPGEFSEGRLGDITIAGLLRQGGVESVTSNGQRGYRIPEGESNAE
jgi:hypothetical protein